MEPQRTTKVLDYHRENRAGKLVSRLGPIQLALSLIVGVAGNVAAVWMTWKLNGVPPGSGIRPMGLALMLLFVAFITFVLAGGLFGFAFLSPWPKPRRRVIWILLLIAAILCVSPLAVSLGLWKYIEQKHSLVMEQ